MESIERSNAQLIEHMNVVYNIVVEYVSGIKGHVLIGRNLLWEYEGISCYSSKQRAILALKNVKRATLATSIKYTSPNREPIRLRKKCHNQ